METNGFDKNRALSSFGFIPEEVLEKLKRFNIITIGHLLSATKGLTKVDLLFTTVEEIEMMEKLQESIPEKILKEYAAFTVSFPTGLITNKNEENEKNNSDNTK